MSCVSKSVCAIMSGCCFLWGVHFIAVFCMRVYTLLVGNNQVVVCIHTCMRAGGGQGSLSVNVVKVPVPCRRGVSLDSPTLPWCSSLRNSVVRVWDMEESRSRDWMKINVSMLQYVPRYGMVLCASDKPGELYLVAVCIRGRFLASWLITMLLKDVIFFGGGGGGVCSRSARACTVA